MFAISKLRCEFRYASDELLFPMFSPLQFDRARYLDYKYL